MDPQLARWHVIDAMAESYYSHTPYAYTMNDPVNFTDLLGLKAMSQLSSDDDWSVGVGQMDYVEGEGWQWFSNHTSGISSGNTGSSGISRVGPTAEDKDQYEKEKKNGETTDSFGEWYRKRMQALRAKYGNQYGSLEQARRNKVQFKKSYIRKKRPRGEGDYDPSGQKGITVNGYYIEEVVTYAYEYYWETVYTATDWFDEIESGEYNYLSKMGTVIKSRLSHEEAIDYIIKMQKLHGKVSSLVSNGSFGLATYAAYRDLKNFKTKIPPVYVAAVGVACKAEELLHSGVVNEATNLLKLYIKKGGGEGLYLIYDQSTRVSGGAAYHTHDYKFYKPNGKLLYQISY
jgi:hypothetical protein